MLGDTVVSPFPAGSSAHAGFPWESHMSWLPPHAPQHSSIHTRSRHPPPRGLNDKNNDYNSYLVDGDGNAYEPYSLAWRYLGIFMDCEDDEQDESGSDEDRRLSSDDRGKGCARKVLWAAVSTGCHRRGDGKHFSLLCLARNHQ
jgi:hypothetical protein